MFHSMYFTRSYKQRGPYLPNVPRDNAQAAVDSYNVYFHLMYEGAVELATLKEKDPTLMHRVTALIDNYGQVQTLSLGLPCGCGCCCRSGVPTSAPLLCFVRCFTFLYCLVQIPMQLFTHPHGRREPPEAVLSTHFPILSCSTFHCLACCRVVGVELCRRPWANRPRRLVPWPPQAMPADDASIPVHESPLLFVGHTPSLVCMMSKCALPYTQFHLLMCDDVAR